MSEEIKSKEITKAELINKLKYILDHSCKSDDCIYYCKVRDWQNYSHDRTYFSIVEKGKYSTKYINHQYGYYDNISGEYYPHRYGDLRKNYDLGGMDIKE